MTSIPGPITSRALVVASNPKKMPFLQTRAYRQRIHDILMERSFKAQISDCRLSAVPIRNWILAGAFPRPQAGPGLPTPYRGTCGKLLDTISKTVHATIDGIDYNGLPPYIKMLDQLEEGSAFRDISIDSRNEEPGTTCVGSSHALLKTLKAQHGVEGMFAPQRIQGKHAFAHAAVIIECQDGYVLLDPRDAPNLRIFSIPFEQKINQENFSITASKPGSTIPIVVTYSTPSGEETFEYCTNLANGDDLVMKHFMMEAPFLPPNDPAFPISAYYPNGGASKCIWVSILQSKLTLKNMTLPKGSKGRTEEISFQEILEGGLPSRLKRLYDVGMPTFHTPFDLLRGQLFKLVEKAEIVREIFQAHF